MGCGILNFVGAIPAFFTIDRFGRRKLLITTLPCLGFLLFITAASFKFSVQETKVGVLLTMLYAFMLAYSPGMGPVPFTYCAEVFSLSARPLGMASATAITWMFNFVISFTFPAMMKSMGTDGAFCFYGACNFAGAIYVWFYFPETKERSLEALDSVFSGTNRAHARRQWVILRHEFQKNILCMDVKPLTDIELRGSPKVSRSDATAVEDKDNEVAPGGRSSTVHNRQTENNNQGNQDQASP